MVDRGVLMLDAHQEALKAAVAAGALTQEQAARDLIRRFVQACEDRHFRVKAVYHIIRGMR